MPLPTSRHTSSSRGLLVIAMLVGCKSGSSSTDSGSGSGWVGSPAATGDPSTKLFNGLLTVADPSAHLPLHGIAAVAGVVPTALASDLPYIANIKVLARRDTVIVYLPNIAGAADYRAYAVTNDVSFVDTANGKQPRGAVIACAGFRQHTYRSAVVDGHHTRELLQAVELPGFVSTGDYTVIVEATDSPCPYVGMPAHTDTQITMANDGTTNWFHSADPATYRYTGIPVAMFSAFDTVKSKYGNEILNGQGAVTDWPTRETVATIGAVVPPNDPTFPSDPKVIARSALAVHLPFADETVNAPVIDVGAHATVDNFDVDQTVLPTAMTQNPDYGTSTNNYNGFSLDPVFHLGDQWSFWARFSQAADAVPGTQSSNVASADAFAATQVFSRHGRLYTTFGDGGEDVGGTMSFSSLTQPVLEMEGEKYIHSMFRLNSDASHRRYWYWTICGGASADELFDSAAHEYKLRPLLFETSFTPGGNNPSVPDGHTLQSSSTADDAVGIAKECVTITEEGRPEDTTKTDGSSQPSAVIRAQIHPANKSHGIIALGTSASDTPAPNGPSSLGFRFKIDGTDTRTGPMIDPFDQLAPLTHYNIFVRPDRIIVFVSGRQGFCVDLSDHPLTMQYAMIGYGDLIYHSSVEWQEVSGNEGQLYQYQLNTPIASSRIWDFIGQADHVDVPGQFATFDLSLCRKPQDLTVQGS